MASCTKAWEGFALQSDTEPSCLEHSDLIPTAWQTAPQRGTALQQAAQNRAGEWGKELLGGPALPWLFHPAVDESRMEPERKKMQTHGSRNGFHRKENIGLELL